MSKHLQPNQSKIDPRIIAAIIALIGTVIAAIFASPVIIALIEKSQAPASSPAAQTLAPASNTDPAGCRSWQDSFSQANHWGDGTLEWGEWGHVNGAYRMKLQHPGGVLMRAASAEAPENFRVSVSTLVTIPGGTWGIYYFYTDAGQTWSAFELDADGNATIKKYQNGQSSILGQGLVPMLGQNRLTLENIGGEISAYVNDKRIIRVPATPPVTGTFGIGLMITSQAAAPVEVMFDDYSFSACP